MDIQLDLPVQNISLHEIDVRGDAHRLSFGRSIEPLVESLRRIGLIQPVLLCPGEEKRFVILSGFRRLEAWTALGRDRIPCRALDRPFNALERLEIAFWENLVHRGFNPAEKARAVERFLKITDEETVIKRILPALALHPHRRELDRMLKIADSHDKVLEELVTGRISAESVIFLHEFPERYREAVFSFLLCLNLNLNRQKEMLETLLDLSLRDGVSAEELTRHEEIQAVLNNEILSTPQKAERIREMLKARLHPRLTQAEEIFRDRLHGLGLPKSIRVRHAPSFETENLQLTVELKDLQELRRSLRLLEDPRVECGFDALFRLALDPSDEK